MLENHISTSKTFCDWTLDSERYCSSCSDREGGGGERERDRVGEKSRATINSSSAMRGRGERREATERLRGWRMKPSGETQSRGTTLRRLRRHVTHTTPEGFFIHLLHTTEVRTNKKQPNALCKHSHGTSSESRKAPGEPHTSHQVGSGPLWTKRPVANFYCTSFENETKRRTGDKGNVEYVASQRRRSLKLDMLGVTLFTHRHSLL